MLKLINVSKSFSSTQTILSNINLDIHDGDFCVILGHNGSGKSTLLRSITGEYTIDSGKIVINGVDLTAKSRAHLIASVVQDINQNTISSMTLLENMILAYRRSHAAKLSFYRNYKKEMLAYLSQFTNGLEQYIDKPLSILSGGQKQILATLMAIISKPKILVLDEHTSALDPNTQQILMQYTSQQIVAQNLTSLMITHKLDDALKYGNRLLVLQHGKIILDVSGSQKAALSIKDLEAQYAH